MSRLVWGDSATRFYETGLDRGVLYSSDSSGVSWSGLISVTESPSGGDPRPFYLDGVKYLNLSSAEEFEATIVAFDSPPEFAVCDGVVSVHNGLFATQQRRQTFGMSYRTLIGNGLDSSPLAYKIHVVYNALTTPSQRSNQTINGSADASTLSWKITTLPPAATGIKRTSHFVIDSRYTDPTVLSTVEDTLYGTDSVGSALPTPDDLIALFA